MTITSQLALPSGFRSGDVIAYHLRDPERVSEAWHEGVLFKGLSWCGQPARLQLRFAPEHVDAALDITGTTVDPQSLNTLVRRMLGLDQDIAGFEQLCAQHPAMAPLVAQQSGLRVAVAASPFEALTWAIIGQQISVQAAVSIRRRFIMASGRQHSSGLWCHPDAATVASLSLSTLKAAGLSTSKAQALILVSQRVADQSLPLDNWLDSPPVAQIREQLLSLRGIGPWTTDYTLLRGYGWLDGSLHGDAAVRRSLRTLTRHDGPISANATRDWLASFSPWRALAAAHLWAANKLQA